MASNVFSIVGSQTFQIRCPAEGSPIAGDQATALGQKATNKKIAGHLVPFLRTTLRQREKDLLNTAVIELWLVARALAISEPLDKK